MSLPLRKYENISFTKWNDPFATSIKPVALRWPPASSLEAITSTSEVKPIPYSRTIVPQPEKSRVDPEPEHTQAEPSSESSVAATDMWID